MKTAECDKDPNIFSGEYFNDRPDKLMELQNYVSHKERIDFSDDELRQFISDKLQMKSHYTPTQINNIRIYFRSHGSYENFVKKHPHELSIHFAIYIYYRYIQKVTPFEAAIGKWSKSLSAKIYKSLTKKHVD